jgi:hypothetical protein
MSDFVMSCRQAAELDHAFERNGWSPQEVKVLSSGDLLASVRRVVLGDARIMSIEPVIDCDAAPLVPAGWEIVEHQKGGHWKWDLKQIGLYLSNDQQDPNVLEGSALRKELADKPVLNSNVLDYLLCHRDLIPEEWKRARTAVFFWGTLYRDADGNLCVRYLYHGAGWWWSSRCLDAYWNDRGAAAVRGLWTVGI